MVFCLCFVVALLSLRVLTSMCLIRFVEVLALAHAPLLAPHTLGLKAFSMVFYVHMPLFVALLECLYVSLFCIHMSSKKLFFWFLEFPSLPLGKDGNSKNLISKF